MKYNEVLKLISEGCSRREMSKKLGINERSVDVHCRKLKELGYIKRKPPEPPVCIYDITAEGQVALENLDMEVEEWEDENA